ncbi:hypothetical protein LTR05_006658 [Lithohypha guttulata]|uniref:Uncharacterized protein n=1 Tax=Lithohypha guttulata TaxID=1690604 RepID=A0AAN7Y4M5_9EURO|nr:hypothetical protein LTR05_006658 [Lithohypha guttulata]
MDIRSEYYKAEGEAIVMNRFYDVVRKHGIASSWVGGYVLAETCPRRTLQALADDDLFTIEEQRYFVWPVVKHMAELQIFAKKAEDIERIHGHHAFNYIIQTIKERFPELRAYPSHESVGPKKKLICFVDGWRLEDAEEEMTVEQPNIGKQPKAKALLSKGFSSTDQARVEGKLFTSKNSTPPARTNGSGTLAQPKKEPLPKPAALSSKPETMTDAFLPSVLDLPTPPLKCDTVPTTVNADNESIAELVDAETDSATGPFTFVTKAFAKIASKTTMPTNAAATTSDDDEYDDRVEVKKDDCLEI